MHLKYYFSIIPFCLFLTLTLQAQAQDPGPEPTHTITYFTNDSISLDLDLFLPEKVADDALPLLIYVHGGGFSGGDRFGGYKLAQYLNSRGYASATITYTLYAKDKGFGCETPLPDKVKAIQIAVSQLWHATAKLVELSEEYHIDTSKIFIAGSSAGAETVMHAAHWDRAQMQFFEPALSPSFRYAGVVSGAGAIMDLNLITRENMVPVMAFHGDADVLVPYDVAAHHYCQPDAPGWFMLFGSKAVAEHLQDLGGTCQFTTFRNGSHSYAGAYFYQNQKPVGDFMERVLAGETFIQFETIVPEVEK